MDVFRFAVRVQTSMFLCEVLNAHVCCQDAPATRWFPRAVVQFGQRVSASNKTNYALALALFSAVMEVDEEGILKILVEADYVDEGVYRYGEKYLHGFILWLTKRHAEKFPRPVPSLPSDKSVERRPSTYSCLAGCYLANSLKFLRSGGFDGDVCRENLVYVLSGPCTEEVRKLAERGLTYIAQYGLVSRANVPHLIEVFEALVEKFPKVEFEFK
jgi:hypothetical protein